MSYVFRIYSEHTIYVKILNEPPLTEKFNLA